MKRRDEVNNGKRFWWRSGIMALGVLLKGFRKLTTEVSTATKQFREFVEILLKLQVALRRIQLEVVLMRRWHVPNDFAYWVAQWWPRRWLPELRIDLGMG